MQGGCYEAAIQAARALERELGFLLGDRGRVGADRRSRAVSQHLRGRLAIWHEPPLHVHELLVTEAAPVEREEPALAALMLADAAMAAAAADVGQAVQTARRAHALAANGGGEASACTQLVLGIALLLSGDTEGDRLVREALGRIDPAAIDPERYRFAGTVLIWLEEYETARAILEELADVTRANGRQMLPNVLDTLAALDFRTGTWTSAEARSAEALRLARELGQAAQTASCLTTLARIQACRGQETECRANVAEALELLGSPDDLNFVYAVSAIGGLELALGRLDEAAAALEKLDREPPLVHEPLVVPWQPDLVETHVRAGRTHEALRVLESFEKQARDRSQTWTRAAAARCRGLLAENGDFDRHFLEALEWHAQTETPFERARTELCFGERLRRARRPAEAKTQLRTALQAFEQLGATSWAERARRELGRRATRARGSEELTPHEREVAELVARGATNREAAAALFVSPRTIEYHLSNAYRKLNVRSRTELACLLDQPERYRRLGGMAPAVLLAADALVRCSPIELLAGAFA